MGDLLLPESYRDLTVLPCSAKGTVSRITKDKLERYNLKSPLELRLHLRRGDISDVIPFPGPKDITRFVVFAASVLDDESRKEDIESIGDKLGVLTNAVPEIQILECPLLGTGAGGLDAMVSGGALRCGFLRTSSAAATLHIVAYDKQRIEKLQTIFQTEGTVMEELSLRFLIEVGRFALSELKQRWEIRRNTDANRDDQQCTDTTPKPVDISRDEISHENQVVINQWLTQIEAERINYSLREIERELTVVREQTESRYSDGVSLRRGEMLRSHTDLREQDRQREISRSMDHIRLIMRDCLNLDVDNSDIQPTS